MRQALIKDYFYHQAYMKNVPVSVMIELLTKCNLRCKHCYLPTHSNSGIGFDKIKSLLYELREAGVVNVSFTGGEIFLRQDLFELIEIARKLHMRVFLLSNGTLLNDKMAERLSNLHIAEFSTTVFSLREGIHDSITGSKGSLEILLNNLQLLKKHNIRVRVKTPLMNVNMHDYKEIKEFCDHNKFDFHVSPLIFSKTDGNEAPKQLRIAKEDLAPILKEIDEQTRNRHLHEYDVTCAALFYSFAIDCNGDVFPCNSFFYKVGNIFNDTIKNIWYESESLKFIKNIKNSDLKACVNCKYKVQCDRCPGMALLDNKSVFACDTFARSCAEIRSNYC